MEQACYTLEAALEKAIEIGKQSLENYKRAYTLVQENKVKTLIKELAFEEMEHVSRLEKALFDESIGLHDPEENEGPIMELTLFLKEKTLDNSATVQDIILYAIYDKKRTVEFYHKMANRCAGAPMEPIFRRLYRDETNHLSRIEKLYESGYMQQM